jgi:hypothetical protein
VFGWLLLPDGRERRRWRAIGIAVGALSLLWLPWHAKMLDGLHTRVQRDGALFRDLKAVAYDPAVRAAVASCGPVAAADHRPMPHLRWWLGTAPGSVTTVAQGAAPMGRLLLLPRRTNLARRFYSDAFPAGVKAPAGWQRVYENRSYRVFAAPACATRG